MNNSEFYFEPESRLQILKSRIKPFIQGFFLVCLFCIAWGIAFYYLFSFQLSDILYVGSLFFVLIVCIGFFYVLHDISKDSTKLNEDKTVKLLLAISGHTKLKDTLFNILKLNKKLLVYDVIRASRILNDELTTLYNDGYSNIYNRLDQDDQALEIATKLEVDVKKYKDWLLAVDDILKDYNVTLIRALPGQKS